MAWIIKWTSEATRTFENVSRDLQKNWTESEVKNFIKLTQKISEFISIYPKMFRYSKKKKTYEAVVTPHNLLLYRIKKNTIELLLFWDTRQNPRKIKF